MMPEGEIKSQLHDYKYLGLAKPTPSLLNRIIWTLQDTTGRFYLSALF